MSLSGAPGSGRHHFDVRHKMKSLITSSIRPFYRSRIFWCGLVGCLLICWSWRDSFQFVRALHTPDRVQEGTSIASYFSFHSRVGILGLSHEITDYAQRKNPTVPERGFSLQSTPLSSLGWTNLREKNPGPFRAPFAFIDKTDREIQTSYFYLAHWTLLLVYFCVWGGAYFLRRSRLRRSFRGADHCKTNQPNKTRHDNPYQSPSFDDLL